MLRAIAPFLLAVALVPAAAIAQPPLEAAVQRPAHVIPFDLLDNRIYLQVAGPGFGQRWFLLDSGAQVTHFTSELVREAGLRTAGRVGISGTGTERIRGAFVAPTTLRLGGVQLAVGRGVSAPAEALFGPVFSGASRRFDGVIGYDLFARYVVQIDYAARQIRLYEPAGYRPPATAETLPIQLVDRKPYTTAVLGLSGESISSNVHLDTGFGGVVSLNANFVAEHRLIERAGPSLTSWNRGVGGITEARTARFEHVSLGSFRIARPVVGLAMVQGAGVRRDSAGRIGGELLRRFTVTFDYRSRTVALEPNAALGGPFEVDMSGLSLVVEGNGEFVVWHVADGTPAAEAGVRPGDRLIAVDGVPAATRTVEEIRALLRREGEGRDLLLQRGEAQVRSRLALRRRL
jgi:hypothetical protein